MTKYARGTEVPSDRSRAEIERTLERYGAQSFAYGWDQESAIIAFILQGKQIKFVLPLPNRNSEEFTLTPSRQYERDPESARQSWEKAVRQRWRALALVIKAKLEAVESNITTIEDEFLAHIVLPDGVTVGELLKPELDAVVRGNHQLPPLLPAGHVAT